MCILDRILAEPEELPNLRLVVLPQEMTAIFSGVSSHGCIDKRISDPLQLDH